jgi:hypothetical protein
MLALSSSGPGYLLAAGPEAGPHFLGVIGEDRHATEASARCRSRIVRKSFALFAVAGIVAAALGAVLGLWLPARHQRQNAAWVAAGERAMAHVALPSSYSMNTYDGRIQVCFNGPNERCFLGPGDPTAQVATVKAALADVATGSVQASCSPVPVPGMPASCHLIVPVSGSRLAADLFAHPRDRSKPVSQWTYAGAYVMIHLDQR